MNASYRATRGTGSRALILSATVAALVAALAAPSRAASITFNPFGTGSNANAITGVAGFGYAPSSVLAFGSTSPTVGSSFNIYAESVINATTGTTSSIGANFTINGSPTQFTAVLGFRETIVSNDGTTVKFALTSAPAYSTSTATPNFFEIYANTPGSASPNSGDGSGFRAGTRILQGHLVQDSYAGNFTLSSSPPIDTFNKSSLATANTTAQTIVGTGSTQFTVAVDSFNSGFFVTNPVALLFSTTNSLPFGSVAPLTGFYSGNTTTPDINYASGSMPFNTGTINGVNGQSTMFQTVATSNFAVPVPEPASLVPAATAATLLPLFLAFRRRSSKPGA
jgi:hypothetical protein